MCVRARQICKTAAELKPFTFPVVQDEGDGHPACSFLGSEFQWFLTFVEHSILCRLEMSAKGLPPNFKGRSSSRFLSQTLNIANIIGACLGAGLTSMRGIEGRTGWSWLVSGRQRCAELVAEADARVFSSSMLQQRSRSTP